ncbi:MAG: hypothetical protein AAFN74_04260 [Myxococcota bacterium]
MKTGLSRARLMVTVGVIAAAGLCTPRAANAEAAIDLFLTLGQNQSTEANSTVVMPRVNVGIPAARDKVLVSIDWGFLSVGLPPATSGAAGQSETSFINPAVDVRYLFRDNRIDFSMGIGMSFPVADADNENRAAAFLVGLGAVSAWKPWLYTPNTLGFFVPIFGRVDFDMFLLSMDGAFFLIIPTENGGGRTTQFGAQAALEALVPIGWFDVGLRAQAVQVGATGASEAYLQTSLAPLTRLYVGRSLEFSFQFNFNFDSPHGTTFATEGTWGMSLGAGVRF